MFRSHINPGITIIYHSNVLFVVFLLRMDENYSIIPHGVNFQDPIFSDTPENHRMFASLFQFSNCTAGTQVHMYTPDWEVQEDNRVSYF